MFLLHIHILDKTSQCMESTSLHFAFGLGVVTSFDQWAVSEHDGDRCLKYACTVGFALCVAVFDHTNDEFE